MIYKIKVTKIEEKKRTEKNWVPVTPYKNKEGEMEKYGYKDIEKTVKEETDIYIQEVEELDLKGVIEAINELN